MLTSVDEYILGNDNLHCRFGAALEIIGAAGASFPESVALEELGKRTGLAPAAIEELCGCLVGAGFLRLDRLTVDAWLLGCDPMHTTLEDVFRCLLVEQLDGSRSGDHRLAPTPAPDSCRDIDLLLMQVAMAINQSAFNHLRMFSLDRLRFSRTASSARSETQPADGVMMEPAS